MLNFNYVKLKFFTKTLQVKLLHPTKTQHYFTTYLIFRYLYLKKNCYKNVN